MMTQTSDNPQPKTNLRPKPPTTPNLQKTSAADPQTNFLNLLIVNGFLLASSPALPNGVYVRSLSEAHAAMTERVVEFLRGGSDKHLFWSINGIGAPEQGVVYIPTGCRVVASVGLRCFATEAGDAGEERMPVLNPRLVVEDDGEVEIMEEFWGVAGICVTGQLLWSV